MPDDTLLPNRAGNAERTKQDLHLLVEAYKAQCHSLMTAIMLARAELLQANATGISVAKRRKHIRAANVALTMPREWPKP